MLSEKGKLEEELRFLDESFGAGVITKEEYDAGKQRVELKLNDLDKLGQEKGNAEEKSEDTKKEAEFKDSGVQKQTAEAKEEEKAEEPEPLEKDESVVGKAEGEQKEDEGVKPVIEESKKSHKKIFTYIGVILVLALGSWYFLFAGKQNDSSQNDLAGPILEDKVLIDCNSDNECSREGKIGVCYNPGKESAECKYIDDVNVELMIINTLECFNCDAGRVMSLLRKFFPNLETKNIDFEAKRGEEIVRNFNINALPAYILNSSLRDSYNYNRISSAFNEVNGSFVVKNTVSNANYYIGRKEIPNKLDLILKNGENASLRAEENLEEFLRSFGDIDFEKHGSDSKIVRELGINIFPTFLINNKIKFSGVQPADTIRENFCQLNKAEECKKTLAKNLI